MEWQPNSDIVHVTSPTPVPSPTTVPDSFGKVVYLNDPLKKQVAPELLTYPGERMETDSTSDRKRKAEHISQS